MRKNIKIEKYQEEKTLRRENIEKIRYWKRKILRREYIEREKTKSRKYWAKIIEKGECLGNWVWKEKTLR